MTTDHLIPAPTDDELADTYEKAFQSADPGSFTAKGSGLGTVNRHKAALRAVLACWGQSK